jgi:hypothetical protein
MKIFLILVAGNLAILAILALPYLLCGAVTPIIGGLMATAIAWIAGGVGALLAAST